LPITKSNVLLEKPAVSAKVKIENYETSSGIALKASKRKFELAVVKCTGRAKVKSTFL
jgi:hypothetical protein